MILFHINLFDEIFRRNFRQKPVDRCPAAKGPVQTQRSIRMRQSQVATVRTEGDVSHTVARVPKGHHLRRKFWVGISPKGWQKIWKSRKKCRGTQIILILS